MAENKSKQQELRPLVTLALFSFNQEKYIREAIEGALAQTYEPLEIIISDDCSSDRTFEITKDIVANYKGPHEIRLNKNTKNVGIGRHVNKVVGMANGQIIVAAAGDDISLPDRVHVLANHLISNPNVYSIYSNMITIDDHGEKKGLWVPLDWRPTPLASDIDGLKSISVFGCSHAFRKKLFDVFGEMHPDVIHEDVAIPFRSMLLGEIRFIPTPYVLYRRHGSNIWLDFNKATTKAEFLLDRKKYLKNNTAIAATRLSDLRIHQDLYNADHKILIEKESRNLTICKIEEKISNETSLVRKIKLFLSLFQNGASIRAILKIGLSEWFPDLIILKRRFIW